LKDYAGAVQQPISQPGSAARLGRCTAVVVCFTSMDWAAGALGVRGIEGKIGAVLHTRMEPDLAGLPEAVPEPAAGPAEHLVGKLRQSASVTDGGDHSVGKLRVGVVQFAQQPFA
jgi:hypothetical protein